MITIERLTKHYKQTCALNEISIDLPSNGVIGVLGPNGSGKTTLFNVMTSCTFADDGGVSLNDEIIQNYDQNKITSSAESVISYIINNQPYYPLTVNELISISTVMHDDFDQDKMQTFIAAFNLSTHKKVRSLTKGQKACLHIALTLSRNVQCYILDEPFDGIDLELRNKIMEQFMHFVDTEKKLILISSHEVRDIERLLDYYVYLDNGTVVEFGEPSSIRVNHKKTLSDYLTTRMRGERHV